MEIFWTGMHSMIVGDLKLSGYSNLWMFFIYGTAVLLEPIHDIIIKWKWPFRGVIWLVIIWGIEYTAGLLLSKILGIYPWYYEGPFAVEGIVNLVFAPAWFIAGLIFEKVHHMLDEYKIA